MMKTDKLLPLINKINQDKKKLNNSKPKFGLPDKTQAKLDAKPIITNQDGQDLFPGIPTLIKGKGPGTPITMRNTNPQVALTPYGAAFMQPNMNYNFAGNTVLELPAAQMGGNPQQDQTMQIIQIYAQMKQMDPNELIKKIQALPQDQQQEAIQSIAQEVQQAMAQQEQAQAGQEGQEPMPEEGMMSYGGEPCIDCFDKYNPSPQAQNLEWFYKKAKGGIALPKHQITPVVGSNNLVNSTQDAISVMRSGRGPAVDVVYDSAKQRYMNLLSAGRPLNQMEQVEMRNLVGQFPKLSSDASIQTSIAKGQAQQKFQSDLQNKQNANMSASFERVNQQAAAQAAKKEQDLKRSLRPGNTTMSRDNTTDAKSNNQKQQLENDIATYGSFENAERAKLFEQAAREQKQSQLYETIDINPNEYASAAMSSPYTGNDPRIIRDAANQTNRQMAPIAAGAAAATGSVLAPIVYNEVGIPLAKEASHLIHKGFTWSPFKGVGAPAINAGNYFTADMLTDAYERAPAWGNALDKAVKTGSKEDVNELLRLSILQGLDISAIAGLPALITSGAKLPKSLEKLRNTGQATKFAQTIKEFEGLIHLGKKASKKELKEEKDPTKGKWGRYADALMGPKPAGYTPDQTFIAESTGVYPNYLNIPQNVATDFYGSRKEGGSALPQHQGRISQTGQNQTVPRDNTSAIVPNIKGIQQMDAFNQAVKNLYGPYTSVSYPDLQTKTPGDSVHLYPGQGGVYFRDFANLVGFSDKTPVDFYNLSKDPRVVVRQDSSWVNANPQYMKNLPSSVRDSLKKQMQPITGKKGGGEAFPQANEYPTDWASYSGNQYQKGKQTGKKTPDYEPNWFARRTSVPGQVLGAVANTLPYFGSIMGKGVYDIGYGLLHEGAPAWVKNAPVTYDDLSYYMMNRRYLNQDPNPTYDKIIQNLSPEELERISGPMFKEGGEAFPQAQTYLPYSRLRRFAQGGPDKPVKGKMDPSAVEPTEADLIQIEAEQAAMQAAAQAQQAQMNQALGYGFYGFDDYVQPYEGMVSPKPGSIPSNQNAYTTPSYFGASDRYSQSTRPVTLQGAQEIALGNNLGAYAVTPAAVQRTHAVTSPQVSPQTSPVTAPATTPPVTNVNDSNWQTNSNVRRNYFELGVQPKFNLKMRPDENTFQNQSLALPVNLGFGNNRWGFNVSGGLNFDKRISNPATVISSDATPAPTSPVRMTTAPITFGATRTGTNSKLGVTGGYSPDSGDFNVGANYTLKFGKKPEQRDGGSFETRPNFMFAEGGDTDDQLGGQLDMDTVYAIMKSGGFAKDPKKKKGKDWDPNDFMSYMKSQGLKKKVGGEMLPMHQAATSQTGTPPAGRFADPTGDKEWTYSYNNGAWTAYDKTGKSYDINKNPKYKISIDRLNAAYPGGKDPNAAPANTNSNTANSGATNSSTTTPGATDNKTDTTTNSGNNASMKPSTTGAMSANPLDYLNMVNSQTGNKGIVGGLTAIANAANLVGYLGTGWGSGENKQKKENPNPKPNLSIQEQNQNKQAKTDLIKKSNDYQNHYLREEPTPEVDPLAQGDFMSSLDSNMPLQQNYTSGYDAYRMQEDGKNPSMMQSRQPSTLSTTQYDDNVRPSNRVPLTPPKMRPEDQPSPYEQFQQDVNDPNSIYYNFNERGDGSNRITNTAPAIMDINAYPFDFYQPVNDNPYQRAYRRGGFIYLPKHATDPIVVSGMQGQGQSLRTGFPPPIVEGDGDYMAGSPGYQAETGNIQGYEDMSATEKMMAQNAGSQNIGAEDEKKDEDKKTTTALRPGVMDFGTVGKNGKRLTFDVVGAQRAVGGLGQIKDYFAGINAEKQADELASKLNTSEFMPVTQVGGTSGNMQDYGDYLVNPTQGPSFRPNAYTQAQKQSKPYMEKALLYGRMGGSLDMYEDGEEYDLTQEEIDQILAAGGSVEYI